MVDVQTDRGDLAEALTALLRQYGLPENVTRFSVHVALDEIIRVDCEFLPAKADEPGLC